MFFRLGLLAHRFRWLIVLGWLVVALLGVYFGPKLPALLTAGGWDDPGSQSSRALQTLRDDLHWPRGTVTLVFEDDPATLRAAATVDRFKSVAAQLRTIDGVSNVLPADGVPVPPYLSDDGRAFHIDVEMNADADQITDRIARFRDVARTAGTRQAVVTGTAAVYYDFQIQSERDLRDAEIVTFPVALLALFFFFGSLASAFLPLVVAGAAVSVTTAIVYAIAQRTTLSVYVLNTATMLGLAVAIDYSLLIVTRFREELRTLPLPYAVARSSATAGRAVLFSGIIVLVGVSGMLFFHFPGITSVGVGGAIVVAFAMLASITLLPAILSILGPSIEFGRIFRRGVEGGMWRRIATTVMRRPFVFIVAVTAIIVALAWPATQMRLGFPSSDALPQDIESRVGLALLQDHFGIRQGDDVIVALGGADMRDPATLRRLATFTSSLRADPRVSRVTSAVDLLPGASIEQYAALYAKQPGAQAQQALRANPLLAQARERWLTDHTAAILVTPANGGLTDPTRDLVRGIREATVGDRDGFTVLVGGITAAEADFNDVVYGRFPVVVLAVVLVTMAILYVLLDSFVLPIKAVIMNGGSVLAAYGVLTLVFQDGYLSGPLGVTARDHIDMVLPILIFCFLFGVSMDYEVFLLTRMREYWDATGNNTSAVASGLERTGRVVTSAAFVFVAVVASFSRADIVTIKAIGLALGTAVFLDATIVRALLVPATMRVLGRWNWWSPIARARPGLEH